ncbi:MAG: hypothetical protein RLZZ292_1629 [Bacteroidota bacterium]|jgi:4-hydroxybenzoate polyprenyltransferase
MHYLQLLRPYEWTKNFFIFIPLFFAGKLGFFFTNPVTFILGFGAFCFTASAVYILNDWKDKELDRLHPSKKYRVIAAEKINVQTVILSIGLLLCLGMTCAYYTHLCPFILVYLGINIAYSFYLKHYALIDITLISSGFLIRIFAGGFLADVPISKWLVLMIFLLAMCLGLGKRREELILFQENQQNTRPVLQGYTLDFLNYSLILLSVTTIICYIMYAVSDEVVHRIQSDNVYLTSFFVILGMLRYFQILFVEQGGGSPTNILLHDRFIQTMLFLWLLTFAKLLNYV